MKYVLKHSRKKWTISSSGRYTSYFPRVISHRKLSSYQSSHVYVMLQFWGLAGSIRFTQLVHCWSMNKISNTSWVADFEIPSHLIVFFCKINWFYLLWSLLWVIEIVYCTHSMDALFWGPYNIQQNGFSVLPDVRTSVYVYSEKKRKNWICDW